MLRYANNNVGQFHTNGSYNSISDKRLKTNIENIPWLLEKLMQLNPSVYEFKFNNPTHEKSIGFIAQEVKSLFPELVSGFQGKTEQGMSDIHTLNYNGFGVIAIKGIQELQLTNNFLLRVMIAEIF